MDRRCSSPGGMCRTRSSMSRGPERIAMEWWRDDKGRALTRDYFRVESKEGIRVWLYREGSYIPEPKQSQSLRPAASSPGTRRKFALPNRLAVLNFFSFLRGGSRPEELVERAKELGLAGLGIADRNSVAGVVRAHTAASKGDDENEEETDIKIAIGARLVFADGTPDILAYPQNRAAWGRLTRLLTVGKSRADKGECTLFIDDLLEHIEGLNLIVMPPRRIHEDTRAPPSHA